MPPGRHWNKLRLQLGSSKTNALMSYTLTCNHHYDRLSDIRIGSYASMRSSWKDLIIPVEREYTVVRPWRWYERWFASLFNIKPKSWNETRTMALPKGKAMMIRFLRDLTSGDLLDVEESVTFDVDEVEPGVLHVQMRDDVEGWTAPEILDLPDKLSVG
ncbi:hypothetical protein CPB85DRAFT_539162 [Mucidula mucida]|nr:hypothetical protein CPB85DRAFT_539162 [Mucidula mucida]